MKLATLGLMVALSAPVALAQSPDATLEVRATQAFNNGDFAVALPMLQKVAGEMKDQPDKLGMVQEKIRVCEKNQTPATSAVTATGDKSAAKASAVSVVNGDRKPHPAPKAGETLDIAIKDLGNFDYDPEQGSAIPDDVKALNGTSVRLHGYMVPLDQAENISKFALVPSLFTCCVGQPPQIQHTIIVTCPKGKAVQYYSDEIVVEGKLNVDTIKDDGFIVGIFSINPTSVKPAVK